MTRIRRRDLERGLRLPAPSPPDDLGRRIKDRIPEDLLAAREEPPFEAQVATWEGAEPRLGAPADPAAPEREWIPIETSGRGRRGRAAWAIAASIALALGAGYLAIRRFDARSPLATDGDRVAMAERDLPRERGLRAAAANDPTAKLARQAAPPIEAQAPASAPAIAAPAPEVAAPRPVLEAPAVAKVAEAKADDAELPVERREIAARKARPAAPGGEVAGAGVAQPLAVAEAQAAAASSDRGRANLDVVDKQMAAVDSPRSDAGSFRDALAPHRLLAATVGDLLDDAAEHAAAASGSGIALAGSGARAPGHLVLLVTASLEGAPATQRPTADPFDLALDRTRVSDWRLLGTHTAGDRTVALYDLELARELDRAALDGTAAMGTVRLRSGAGVAAVASSLRPIHAGDFAAPWSQAPADLRLATLGAEVASLPPGSPATAAALDRELARLQAEAALDADAARGAAELRAAVAPATKEDAAAAAPAPAKRDG